MLRRFDTTEDKPSRKAKPFSAKPKVQALAPVNLNTDTDRERCASVILEQKRLERLVERMGIMDQFLERGSDVFIGDVLCRELASLYLENMRRDDPASKQYREKYWLMQKKLNNKRYS